MRTGETRQREPAAAFTEPGPWSVELTDTGADATGVIRALRRVRPLSLLEAHQLATSAPAVLASGVSEDGARATAAEIERAGGKARVFVTGPT